MRTRTMATAIIVGLVLMAPDHACWYPYPKATILVPEWSDVYTREEEKKMGRENFDTEPEYLARIFGIPVNRVNDPLILSYLYSIERRLLPVIPSRYGYQEQYPIQIIDISDKLMLSQVGGYMTVSLLEVASWRSDDEAMAIVGHEIGHTILRHHAADSVETQSIWEAERMIKRAVREEASRPDRDLTRIRVLLRMLHRDVDIARLLLLQKERQRELNADVFGVQLCMAARCDPESIINFYEHDTMKISDQDKHPPSRTRAQVMEREVRTLLRGRRWPRSATDSPELQAVRRRAWQLMFQKWFSTP